MKICHVAYQTWPTQCGAVTRLEQLLEAQHLLGVDTFVISSPFQMANSACAIECRRGIKYYRTSIGFKHIGFSNAIGFWGRLHKFTHIFSFVRQVWKICCIEKPDIIHAHATFFIGLSAWFVARFMGIPCVYEVRSTWEEDLKGGSFVYLQRSIVKYMERLTIKLSSGTVFLSKGLQEHYCKRIPVNRSALIYNCVKEPTTSSTGRMNDSVFNLGYIGSLYDYEGLENLIKVAQLLRQTDIKLHIDIVGGGPSEQYLMDLTRKMRLDDIITFHGRVNPDSVDSYYNNIDVIVLPRRDLVITNRVAGLKPIEAFSHKKIVVASDVEGMKELFVDGIHGLLFQADNISDMYNKITWVYNNKEIACKIALSGYQLFLEKYTLAAMGKQYLHFYDEVLVNSRHEM
ncbi:glycosyltransferase family 4 protein [Geobacter sulfurreducens]|uniref:Glycosyltransferase, WbuB-like family n=1 Tax=Geobacter sulfurreducens (strain ATCC 51573 / DSM 12127 / PCA) TaxID=243231 RepID=Q74C24_GEOSL|nr:glycosyltransferase family 4 protein [Geobacter sulfurreducens]AAR35228.1 glycosyltransferase, WbuB-like family [Geobacter sulfurreducens PCA]UAC02593.1 glycosyltransferase family 4 protein [Geobacter sulfurreducens]